MHKFTWTFLTTILMITVLSSTCGIAQEMDVVTDISDDGQPAIITTAETATLSEPDLLETTPTLEAESSGQPTPAAGAPTPPVDIAVDTDTKAATLYELQLGEVSDGAGASAPSSDLISISLDKVPVPDVVNMFSRISGANIITAGTFTNLFVTANLRNVEWKSALNLALGSVNLSMIEDPSGILMVVTAEMYKEKLAQIEGTKPLVTRTFLLRYMNAVDLVEQINQMKILSPRGTVITSQSKAQHNANMKSSSLSSTTIQNPSILTEVIVTDLKEYVERIADLIQKLDRREPQVFIEARIIDVLAGDSKKIGFDWSMLDRFGVTAGLNNLEWTYSDTRDRENRLSNRDRQYDNRSQIDGIDRRYNISGQAYEESVTTYEEVPPNSGNWIAQTKLTPTRTISDTIRTGRDIELDRTFTSADITKEARMGAAFLTVSEASLFLSALQKNTKANMISHPLMIVGNKVEAKIHVGQRYPTILSKKDVDSSSGISRDSYSESVEWNDLGLTLWVIPEIDVEADIVRMTVNPQMSTWIKDITTPQGSVYPVISTRHLSSRVNIPSGHTVVIGGLMEDNKTKKETRVPLLGDIPLIGLLFRHSEDVVERSNLLILLTPTILDETEPLTGMEVLAQQALDEFDYVPIAAKKSTPPSKLAASEAAAGSSKENTAVKSDQSAENEATASEASLDTDPAATP